MSLKLLKQSVDIVEQDAKPAHKNKGGKQSNLSSIAKTKHIYNKARNHQPQKTTNLQDVCSELRKESKKSEENMKRLLALSMNTIKVKDAEKTITKKDLLARNDATGCIRQMLGPEVDNSIILIVQRAHKGRYVKKIIPKVEQESIFTEEDFRKFEEEYFNS